MWQVNSDNQSNKFMVLSHLFQIFYFPKLSNKSRFEGKNYKNCLKSDNSYQSYCYQKFQLGCIYRPAFWIQLQLTDFSALFSWFGRTGNGMYTTNDVLQVTLKMWLWPGYQNSKRKYFLPHTRTNLRFFDFQLLQKNDKRMQKEWEKSSAPLQLQKLCLEKVLL